jgi:hypothetical protein
MKIDGNTVVFRSRREAFVVEASGDKSNTVRLLDADEIMEIDTPPKRIRIVCADDPDRMFTRRLTNVMKIGEILGLGMFVFSWSSVEFASLDVDEFYKE